MEMAPRMVTIQVGKFFARRFGAVDAGAELRFDHEHHRHVRCLRSFSSLAHERSRSRGRRCRCRRRWRGCTPFKDQIGQHRRRARLAAGGLQMHQAAAHVLAGPVDDGQLAAGADSGVNAQNGFRAVTAPPAACGRSRRKRRWRPRRRSRAAPCAPRRRWPARRPRAAPGGAALQQRRPANAGAVQATPRSARLQDFDQRIDGQGGRFVAGAVSLPHPVVAGRPTSAPAPPPSTCGAWPGNGASFCGFSSDTRFR